MAYPDDEIKPPSSSTALQPGGFRARDEMRREEHRQLQQIKLGERIDRNINRAIRQGNSKKAREFTDLKESFNGGQIKAGGIGHADDREQRAKDGAAKGAEYRFNAGRLGEAQNPIADAPPPEEKKAPAPVNAKPDGGFTSQEQLQESERRDFEAQGVQQPVNAPPAAQGAPATNPVEQQPQSAYNPGPGFPKPKSTNDALRDRQEFVDSLFRGTAQKNAASQQQSQPGRSPVFPTKHPMVKNPDGSESNVILSGEDIMTPEGKYDHTIAFPTMIDGKRHSKEEAFAIAQKNGIEKYPRFGSVKEMNQWAEQNHGNIDEGGYLKTPDQQASSTMSKALESQRSRMSPEAFASLERSISKLTPEQKKESVATGKAKGEAFAKRTDELVGQARSQIAQAEQGRRDIGQIRNNIATRNDDKTNVSGILGGNSREDFLDSLNRNPSFSTSSTMRTPADEAAVLSPSKPEVTYSNAPLIQPDKKPSPSATAASSDDFGQMSPSDPRYKATQIKDSAYSKAWWATPGSMIPALRQNLDKSPQEQIKEKARSTMISDALEKGVDISEITKQDSKFHKQYEEAKKKKSEQESLKSVASYLSPSGRSFPV